MVNEMFQFVNVNTRPTADLTTDVTDVLVFLTVSKPLQSIISTNWLSKFELLVCHHGLTSQFTLALSHRSQCGSFKIVCAFLMVTTYK